MEQSHPEGWLLKLVFPSSVWIGMIANGQQSTDSITAGKTP